MILTVILGLLCLVLGGLLIVSVRYNIRHARVILDVEDSLSEALDTCDVAYRRMSEVLELPVALNTPEVRQVVEQIRVVRDSVLYVSNVMVSPFGGIEEEEDDS